MAKQSDGGKSASVSYPIDPQIERALRVNFQYHAPTEDQVQRMVRIRDKAKEFAELIGTTCPPSRERSLSITELEATVFWANASIARNESEISKKFKGH